MGMLVIFLISMLSGGLVFVQCDPDPKPGMSSHYQMFRRGLSNEDEDRAIMTNSIDEELPAIEEAAVPNKPLITVNSQKEPSKSSSSSLFSQLPQWLPQGISQEFSSILSQPHVLGDVLRLKWNRIVQVGSALLMLGLVMLLKMVLVWVGPFMASAPAQAFQSAIAKEASRQLLSDVVMRAISSVTGLYG